ELLLFFLNEIALVVKREEEFLRRLVMLRPRRAPEDIEVDAEPSEGSFVGGVILVDDLLRRDVLLIGRDLDRHAVFIRTGDVNDVLSVGSEKARIDVRRQISPG